MAVNLTYFECFNTKLAEFLQDLSTSFPEFKDIKMLKNGLNLARTLDVKMPATMFSKHVTAEYEQNILNKDDAFFLTQTYEHIAVDGIDLDIIPKLKDMWGTLDVSDKDSVWKYLQVLVLLCRKCGIRN
jgi:hypothetical protein